MNLLVIQEVSNFHERTAQQPTGKDLSLKSRYISALQVSRVEEKIKFKTFLKGMKTYLLVDDSTEPVNLSLSLTRVSFSCFLSTLWWKKLSDDKSSSK